MPYIGPIDDYCFDYILDELIQAVTTDNEFTPSDLNNLWVSSHYPDDFVEEWEDLSDDDKFQVVEDLSVAATEALAPQDF